VKLANEEHQNISCSTMAKSAHTSIDSWCLQSSCKSCYRTQYNALASQSIRL